jgi:hypothetical protein
MPGSCQARLCSSGYATSDNCARGITCSGGAPCSPYTCSSFAPEVVAVAPDAVMLADAGAPQSLQVYTAVSQVDGADLLHAVHISRRAWMNARRAVQTSKRAWIDACRAAGLPVAKKTMKVKMWCAGYGLPDDEQASPESGAQDAGQAQAARVGAATPPIGSCSRSCCSLPAATRRSTTRASFVGASMSSLSRTRALFSRLLPGPPTFKRERVCCLLVLNLVSSTLSCIRRPRPRLLVLDVCGFV